MAAMQYRRGLERLRLPEIIEHRRRTVVTPSWRLGVVEYACADSGRWYELAAGGAVRRGSALQLAPQYPAVLEGGHMPLLKSPKAYNRMLGALNLYFDALHAAIGVYI